jgi:3-hydroxybutyrate dehydrogenase
MNTLSRRRAALVTGSTSGIGLGIARAFASAGWNVMLNGLGDRNEIEALRDSMARSGNAEIRYHDADLTRPSDIEAMVRETEKAFGGVDALVNNAGIQHVAATDQFPPGQWERVRSIILDASFHAIRAALPGMKARGWGRIINLVSVHGLVASPFKSAYVSAKHGQVGLTKTVALELAETGITCNAICPGFVLTPLVEGQIAAQAKAHGIPRENVIRDVILASQPSKRFVTVEEIADLALFLCSESARSITGASIPIDGGWTAR